MPEPTLAHASFTIERDYKHEPKRVFEAFADPEKKAKWFGAPDKDLPVEAGLDFRVGGKEYNHGQFEVGSPISTYDAVYVDIVENERIVYTYEMTLGGRKLSVSVASIEFLATDQGTHLVMTEHGVYYDGNDDPSLREHGTNWLMDEVGRYLDGEG